MKQRTSTKKLSVTWKRYTSPPLSLREYIPMDAWNHRWYQTICILGFLFFLISFSVFLFLIFIFIYLYTRSVSWMQGKRSYHWTTTPAQGFLIHTNMVCQNGVPEIFISLLKMIHNFKLTNCSFIEFLTGNYNCRK